MKHYRDYSQPGDPYGLAEYTSQSADQDVERAPRVAVDDLVDVRGNEMLPARNVPTQAEADAIKAEI